MPTSSPDTESEVVRRYGYNWPAGHTELTIELAAFLMEISVAEGGLGRAGHARKVIDMLWNQKGSRMKFDWHPWAIRMLDAACENKFLSVAGAASTGKTDFFAVWAIINYLADPLNTKVLITSTSLKDSRLRIWGRVMEYWLAVPGLPGNLVGSLGVIRYVDPITGKQYETSGITLLAGEPKKEKENIGKLLGFKRRRVFVIADEMPELSHAILEAALGNLDVNPYFSLVGIGNPNSYYDAFGVFSEPLVGWKNVSPLDDDWPTKDGLCIRLDGEKSPNVLAGEMIYPYLLTKEKLDEKREKLGANSLLFWRMYRGFWSPVGSDTGVYSEADIVQNQADSREVFWKDVPARVAFLDSSFSEDGDRAAVMLGKIGLDVNDRKVLMFDEDPVFLQNDITQKEVPINFQIAEQYRDLCLKEGVTPSRAGVDSTGGGGPFCDILAVVWSPDIYRCYFGGRATDRQVSATDDRKGHEAYANRMSEIWYAGTELIRTRQLKGMGRELIKEAVARLYSVKKRGTSDRIEVEPKGRMKARIGKSPDIADAAFGLLDLCREKFQLLSVEREHVRKVRSEAREKNAKPIPQPQAANLNGAPAPVFGSGLGMVANSSAGFMPLRRN